MDTRAFFFVVRKTFYNKMTDIKRVGEAGVYTIEGNVAGGRAARLTHEREKQKKEYEEQKNKLKQINATDLSKINNKFSSASDFAEQEFRRKTVGLVTAEEFRKAREEGEQSNQANAELLKEEQERKANESIRLKNEEKERKRRKMMTSLSFGGDLDDEDGENEEELKHKKPMKRTLKNPTVDTSFLPDSERERELELKKEALKREWLEQQEIMKNEVNLFCYFHLFFL
jgi:protein FAM50